MSKTTPQAPEREPAAAPDTLPIHAVHYQRLVSLGNYENERVGAWCAVEDGRTPEETLASLKTWVQAQVGQHQESVQLEQDVYRLRAEKLDLESQVRGAREGYERAKAFLEGMGLKVPARYTSDDDMPF